MASHRTRAAWLAAAVVAVCSGLVAADVPSTFPATYPMRQRLVVSFTLLRAGHAYTLTRHLGVNGSIVLDSAAALHFEPAYSGGTATATYSQHGANKVEFGYDEVTTGLLHDYYLGQLVDGGALRSSDDFRLEFGDGKFVFRRGISKVRGHQTLRYSARRNGHVILRGRGTLTWSGSQG
jgi:hypothetical protein